MEMSLNLKRIIVTVCFASFFVPGQAMAISPHKNVISPFLAAGEREIELNIGTRTQNDSTSKYRRESSATLGYGYAFTNYYKSEVELKFTQADQLQAIDGASLRIDAVEWENHLLFSDRGEYFIDPGIFWEYERMSDRALGHKLYFGALLRKDIGFLELQFNPYFERYIEDQTNRPMKLLIQGQAKYRVFQTKNQSTISLGVQGWTDFGKWDNWEKPEDREVRIGPAFFYKWRTGYNRNAWNGSVAYLFDTTGRNWGSRDSLGRAERTFGETVRAMIEYEF